MSAAVKNSKGENPAHLVYISLGSNIAPRRNLVEAVRMLEGRLPVEALSSVWETPAVGGHGPDFLNLAARLRTSLSPEALKEQILLPIEAALGRRRSEDKNAPRPIDLDILIYDEALVDSELWDYAHLAVPLAEIYPDYPHPESGESLEAVARRLEAEQPITQQPGVIPQTGLD